MRQQQRFGDVLRRFVGLSRHDIDEVLEEQKADQHKRRFGEIALSLGLCQPEHVWQAWCFQLGHHPQRIDLAEIGIDAQATIHLSRLLALEYGVMPIRSFGGQVVLAVDESSLERATKELPLKLNLTVRFVIADRAQIDCAIMQYYPRITDRAA